MTREKHFFYNPKEVRDTVNLAIAKANKLHDDEEHLIQLLSRIDEHRFYVWTGYKSLRGFCNHVLRFSKTQSQRITTQVRRYEPTSNIGKKVETHIKDSDCIDDEDSDKEGDGEVRDKDQSEDNGEDNCEDNCEDNGEDNGEGYSPKVDLSQPPAFFKVDRRKKDWPGSCNSFGS